MEYSSFLISVRAAWRGIIFAFTHERNFRIEVYVAISVLAFMVVTGARLWQYAVVCLLIVMVFAMELANTALERIVDILKPHKHPYARIIKDLAAALVLVMSAGVAVVGSIILWPLLVDFVAIFMDKL